MLQLNVDFNLLNRFFGITPAKAIQYANKDFEEIMRLEAEAGNEKAAEYKKILSDPEKLYQIFKLSSVENKFLILQNMSEADLDNLLPFLTQEQLALGLNFFNEEKLMTMTRELPIEVLCEMMFEKFNLFDVLSLMDESSMDEFLAQPDVERDYIQKYFESLTKDELEKIMIDVYGADEKDKAKDEYISHIENLDDNDFSEFILSMEIKSKIALIEGVCSNEKELVYLFENDDMARPMELLMKNDKVQMMSMLDSEFLIPMIEELPIDLTQIVLTQIDPREFSEILAEDFQDILASVVLFSGK